MGFGHSVSGSRLDIAESELSDFQKSNKKP